VTFHVDPDVVRIVRPLWHVFDAVRVVLREPRLDDPLRQAALAVRGSAGPDGTADVVGAVRTMYRRVGLDPTKVRPASEALGRRVRRGEELPRINSLVDVTNWCSLETELPFGLYDRDRLDGDVTLRLGREGEEYAGIRKDVVHVSGRLTLADAAGPFGNPTSDSARTMVTPATTRALVVIFGPADLPAAIGDRAMALTRERVTAFCGA